MEATALSSEVEISLSLSLSLIVTSFNKEIYQFIAHTAYLLNKLNATAMTFFFLPKAKAKMICIDPETVRLHL